MTSYLQSAADSFGLDQQVEHDERYRMADEFMDVVYKLLEASWDEDAVEWNKKTGVYTNPDKVRTIGQSVHFLFQIPMRHLSHSGFVVADLRTWCLGA